MVSKALVVVGAGSHAELLDIALPTFHDYAERHGYEVIIDDGRGATGRPGQWSKIPALQHALEHFELALWLDADVLIVDPSRDIADELGPGDYQGLVEIHSIDGAIPNTGVWVLRAGERAQRFLADTWRSEQFIDHMWADQAAAVTVLGYELAPWLPSYSLSRPCHCVRSSSFAEGTRLLPPEWNSIVFFKPVEGARMNHYAGGWPLQRRVDAMLADARKLPGHTEAPVPSDDETPSPEEFARRMQAVEKAVRELARDGERFIVVDEDTWRPLTPLGASAFPILERDGQYAGRPDGDADAIAEVERLREAGASKIVFVWPTLWWLESYAQLERHLRSTYALAHRDDNVVAFDLLRAAPKAERRRPEPLEVRGGPYAGMVYPPEAAGRDDPTLAAKLAGTYDAELHPMLEQVVARRYPRVVDLSAGDGYHAVGLVRISIGTRVWGFETDVAARLLARALSERNGVAKPVVLQRRCDTAWLAQVIDADTLVFAGPGTDPALLSIDQVPALGECDLLVYLPADDSAPADALGAFAFSTTHSVTRIAEVARTPRAAARGGWAFCAARRTRPVEITA